MQLLQHIFSSPLELLIKVENDKVALERSLVGFDGPHALGRIKMDQETFKP